MYQYYTKWILWIKGNISLGATSVRTGWHLHDIHFKLSP